MVRISYVLAVASLAVIMLGQSARAEEVSIKGNSHTRVQGKCSDDGDVYWTEGKTGSTYGCLHADGSGIVCGGVTAQQKQTCSTFRQASFQKPQLPTRDLARRTGDKKD
jgi:hypothetical protein